jgi:hypothetical protein
MRMIQLAGHPVHSFQNACGRFQWEPLGIGEPWSGLEEYGSPDEAENAAQLWGEDLAEEAE